MIKPKKIPRNNEYYLRLIRNKKADLEELTGKKKTDVTKQLEKLRGKLK